MGTLQSEYRYRTLEYADSIRLLRLNPAEDHKDDLRGSLLQTTLWDRSQNLLEPYTALSYVWGHSEKTHIIRLDDHHMGITASLDSALRDMRDRVNPRQIWADALCINQSNAEEKAAQVALMGRIYSTANHTIIHIPLITPGIERLINSALRAGSGLRPRPFTSEVIQADPDFEEPRRQILVASWFTRAWVFQELLLSLDPWVQTSNTSRARWADFCKVVGPKHIISAMQLTQLGTHVPDRQTDPSMKITEPWSRMPPMPLYSLLATRRGIGTTDPRDIVYANLGIVSDTEDLERYITVDYSRSIEDLFYDAARYILGTAGFDYLIYQAIRAYNKEEANRQVLNLASWIPDWTRRAHPSNLGDQKPRTMALGSGPAIQKLDRRLLLIELEISGAHQIILNDPPTLSFTGLVWDTIDGLSAPIPELALPTLEIGHPRASVYTTPLKAFSNYRRIHPPSRGHSEEFAFSRLTEISDQASKAVQSGLGMLHRTDVDNRGRLPSGRLAAGKNGSLHIVPEEAIEGDVIVEVGPSHMVLVLRPIHATALLHASTESQPLGPRIMDAFESANAMKGCIPQIKRPHKEATVAINPSEFGYPKRVEWREKLNTDATVNIQHHKLVGEALCIQLVQPQYASFGWTPPPPKATVMEIFTLH
jgi:hypothetical protein